MGDPRAPPPPICAIHPQPSEARRVFDDASVGGYIAGSRSGETWRGSRPGGRAVAPREIAKTVLVGIVSSMATR